MVRLIHVKQLRQLSVVGIICACASLVATLFLNFLLDLKGLDTGQLSLISLAYYQAQERIALIVASISGLVLVATAIAMIFFFIRQFIEDRQTDLGILKALGYNRRQLASQFWVFGAYGLVGTALGCVMAFVIMPHFYQLRDASGLLPGLHLNVHWGLVLALMAGTSAVLLTVSTGYAYHVLGRSALALLKGEPLTRAPRRAKRIHQYRDFLHELRASLFWRHKFLIFLVGFAAFCFAAMLQLALGMHEMMDVAMQVMMIGIGLVLALAIIYLAYYSLFNRYKESLAVLKALGYSQAQCLAVTFRPYRWVMGCGFLVGTVYQFFIIRLILRLALGQGSGDVAPVFNLSAFLVTGCLLALLYGVMSGAMSRRIQALPLKAIIQSAD